MINNPQKVEQSGGRERREEIENTKLLEKSLPDPSMGEVPCGPLCIWPGGSTALYESVRNVLWRDLVSVSVARATLDMV